MAFTTKSVSATSGRTSNVYNIDFTVGPGARGNLPDDVMLVQALFRIVHFEVALSGGTPVPPPAGHTSIAIDGKLGPITAKFISNWQILGKKSGMNFLTDGLFDPFRKQEQLSLRAHVRYALEVLNDSCFDKCRKLGIANYDEMENRTDIPTSLASALKQRRTVARQYAKGTSFA